MASPQTIIALVALALAVVYQMEAKGRSLIGWSAILICVVLLWGFITR